MCQRISSLWFHRTLPPFRRRFSESMASNHTSACFQSHLREIRAKSAWKEFPAHCFIGKEFFMCQKERGGAEKVMSWGPQPWPSSNDCFLPSSPCCPFRTHPFRSNSEMLHTLTYHRNRGQSVEPPFISVERLFIAVCFLPLIGAL